MNAFCDGGWKYIIIIIVVIYFCRDCSCAPRPGMESPEYTAFTFRGVSGLHTSSNLIKVGTGIWGPEISER